MEGVKFLAQSGVLKAQLERLKENTLRGSADEKDESIAIKVKEFRRQSGLLLALQELGVSLSKENEV